MGVPVTDIVLVATSSTDRFLLVALLAAFLTSMTIFFLATKIPNNVNLRRYQICPSSRYLGRDRYWAGGHVGRETGRQEESREAEVPRQDKTHQVTQPVRTLGAKTRNLGFLVADGAMTASGPNWVLSSVNVYGLEEGMTVLRAKHTLDLSRQVSKESGVRGYAEDKVPSAHVGESRELWGAGRSTEAPLLLLLLHCHREHRAAVQPISRPAAYNSDKVSSGQPFGSRRASHQLATSWPPAGPTPRNAHHGPKGAGTRKSRGSKVKDSRQDQQDSRWVPTPNSRLPSNRANVGIGL